MSINIQEQLNLEREIGKELTKRIELLKNEKEDEIEKYKILLLAFEELYNAHSELLKKQENLITTDLSIQSDHKNELLAEYDEQVDLMKQIRHRSGIDVNIVKHRGRRTSSLDGYITGSSLLRTSNGTSTPQRLSGRFQRLSIDEGTISKQPHRLSAAPIMEVGEELNNSQRTESSTSTSRAPSVDQPKRRLSLFQGIQKSLPILHLQSSAIDDSSSQPIHSEHSSNYDEIPQSLSSVFGGFQRNSISSPTTTTTNITGTISSSSIQLYLQQPPIVPLFEHFLVIGVSVDAALSVSDQLIQKQTKLSQRLMNKLSGLFRSSGPGNTINGTRGRSASQLTISSNDSHQESTQSTTESSFFSSTTSSTTSRGLFSRMLSREDVGETSSRNSVDMRPSMTSSSTQNSGWASSFFNRMATSTSSAAATTTTTSQTTSISREVEYEQPHEIVHSSTDSEQSTPTASPTKSSQLNSSPSPHSIPSPNAIATVLGQGSKNEHATFTNPEILYRYPDDADPPPPEVCDFCMPSGGKLRHLQSQDSETTILEIMYGHGQNQRNSRCFIFILEDKTINLQQNIEDCESGINTGRTYGICVVHPRLLNPKHPSGLTHDEYLEQQNLLNSENSQTPTSIEFEASVIFNMITYERMMRMEKIDPQTSMTDRHVYEYVPISVYQHILDKLSLVAPPKYNTTLNFTFSPTVAPICFHRMTPTSGTPEHILRAAEWALPPLIRWLNPKILVWALGLLMCEVKLIVIGVDPAIVSCAVIGLTSLLKPLQWVNPMIPIMPLKHIEFLESPVPLVAGMVVDGDHQSPQSLGAESITPLSLLKLCDDGESVSAVLDLSARDIFVLNSHSEVVPELIFPQAEDLIQDIQTALYCHSSTDSSDDIHLDGTYSNIIGAVRRENKPNFNVTPDDLTACKAIQELVYKHLTMVGKAAKEVAGEVLKEQMEAVEQRVKANLEKIEKFKHNANQSQSQSSNQTLKSSPSLASLSEVINEDGDGDIDEKLENEDHNINGSGNDHIDTVSQTNIPFQNQNQNQLQEVSSTNNTTTTTTTSPTNSITRSVSLPIPAASSIIIGAGSVIPIVSLQNMFIDTTETQKLFLRRFVTTQIFTEYDQEIIDILHDMNIVNERFDDSIIGKNRLPGTIGTSASNISRKSLNSTILSTSSSSLNGSNSNIGSKVNHKNRGVDGRSRSLYITSNDYKF